MVKFPVFRVRLQPKITNGVIPATNTFSHKCSRTFRDVDKHEGRITTNDHFIVFFVKKLIHFPGSQVMSLPTNQVLDLVISLFFFIARINGLLSNPDRIYSGCMATL